MNTSLSGKFDTFDPSTFERHSLNNSCSKMQYSFPRSDRWRRTKQAKGVPYYDMPSELSKRSTSFGYGNKTTFNDSRQNPPPNKYLILSKFLDRKHGISFGIGREQSRHISTFASVDAPGPGMYNPKMNQGSPSYSMKPRHRDRSLDEMIKMPGPGQYEVPQLINKDGKYSTSKYQNSKCSIIPKAEKRIKTEIGPSPNTYFPRMLNSRGEVSMMQSRTGKFGRSRRLGIEVRNDTPGPGQYHRFSEFIRR